MAPEGFGGRKTHGASGELSFSDSRRREMFPPNSDKKQYRENKYVLICQIERAQRAESIYDVVYPLSSKTWRQKSISKFQNIIVTLRHKPPLKTGRLLWRFNFFGGPCDATILLPG